MQCQVGGVGGELAHYVWGCGQGGESSWEQVIGLVTSTWTGLLDLVVSPELIIYKSLFYTFF